MSWFGTQQKCLACGQTYGADVPSCPRCLVAKGQTMLKPVEQGGPIQIIRAYKGNHAQQAFQKEAQLLARVGWMVSSQSVGGYNAYKIGKRMPILINVIYTRMPVPAAQSAQAPAASS